MLFVQSRQDYINITNKPRKDRGSYKSVVDICVWIQEVLLPRNSLLVVTCRSK